MCAISTVPFCAASSACSAGTISPAAKVWIWNLLSVASATILAIMSAPPNNVSSDFGQLAVRRHFSCGIDWAIAGVATAAPGESDTGGLEKLTTLHCLVLPLYELTAVWAQVGQTVRILH